MVTIIHLQTNKNRLQFPSVILKHYLQMPLHMSFVVMYGHLPSIYAYVTLPLQDDISFLNHPPSASLI